MIFLWNLELLFFLLLHIADNQISDASRCIIYKISLPQFLSETALITKIVKKIIVIARIWQLVSFNFGLWFNLLCQSVLYRLEVSFLFVSACVKPAFDEQW